MRLLLDTHVLLWWLADDDRLSAPARDAVNIAADVWFSAASVWEVAIKRALGRLEVPENYLDSVDASDIRLLPITGQQRKVVMVANRNGFFYVFDRATGKLLVGKPFSDTTWARELDANGVDRSLVRWMLRQTPAQRLAYAQGVIDLAAAARRSRDGAR